MADSDSNLNLRLALSYLGQELQKRMDNFGAQCLELRKKEQAATLSKNADCYPGDPAMGKDEDGPGGDLAMGESKGKGFDKKPIPFKYQSSCDNCGSDVHDKDESLCPKCKAKSSVKKDEVPASERREGSVLPEDKKAKEISAEGSGGDVKKLKKDAMAGAPKAKAAPPPIPADAKPAAPKAAPAAAPKAPAMGAGTPQAGGMKSPRMAGAAIPPPTPGMKPMKLPGVTLPKGPGVSAPIKTDARLGKEELGKAAISPRDAAADASKRPAAAASAGKLMDTMLAPKAMPSAAPAMPKQLPSSGPIQLAGVGQPAAAPAKGVQTMTERVASGMGKPAHELAGPPRIALPGAGLFAKKPAAVPPPVPADAKPMAKPVK